jgi:hypothetical protein
MKKLLAATALIVSFTAMAQQRDSIPSAGGARPTLNLNALSGLGARPSTSPRPFKEVITDKAVTKKGLFTVHKVDDKYYFEINDSILGREILAVTRYVKVPAGAGYGGEIANQHTLTFEKGIGNTVFLRVITLINTADSTNDIYKAVNNSNVNSIAQAFPIAAFSKDSSGVVIDVTDYFKGDNLPVSINANAKRRFSLTAIAPDRSFIQKISTYPINTEIRTIKTFSSSGSSSLFGLPTAPSPFPSASLPAASASGAVTMELNTSLLLLPKKPMQHRVADKRVGFFTDDYVKYSDEQQQVENKEFAVRWRLEPKDGEYEKWLKGELVEPKKPIVYYIDPATPKQWRKYLIAGVNDWQKAFEKAGFKNAIMAKEWPNDSTMSTEDARFSVIRYFASDIENAYGPNVHDPRSGEILESHIGWYHNVMKLVHDWYMIQTAAVDPRARGMKFSDELMGDLIRFVSSHEVGHTLGLRHNMGSSSKTPVEKLRDKQWVEANGHTASIMDYARFNYVAQPEDNISKEGLYPRIGDYDLWAIKWGYGYIGGATDEDQKKISSKMIIDAYKANPRTWFGTYESGNPADPRAQSEDLSDNAVKASEYGIKNLQRILPKLSEWTYEEADLNENIANMYGQLITQFRRYMGHVTKNIGGIYETFKSIDEKGDVYEIVPKAYQKQAVQFLNKQLFETPKWLVAKDIWNRTNNPIALDPVASAQESTLNSLISIDRMNRMQICLERYGADKAYNALELLTDVQSGLFSELSSNKPIDEYRRILQKSYVEKLSAIINPSNGGSTTITIQGFTFGPSVDLKRSDVPAIVRAQLVELKNKINAGAASNPDKMSKIHLQDLSQKIKNALDPK